MPLLWRSSRESRSERCKGAFLLAPICKVLLAPTLVSDRATPSFAASERPRRGACMLNWRGQTDGAEIPPAGRRRSGRSPAGGRAGVAPSGPVGPQAPRLQ